MRYEFTLTLKPALYRHSAKEQYRITSNIVHEIIGNYKVSVVAELTSQNNIHYHGIVELTDFAHRDAFINKIRQWHKEMGRYSCSQLVDEPVWIEYMRKNTSKTDSVINKWPWVKDDFKISGEITFKVSSSGNIYIEGYRDDRVITP